MASMDRRPSNVVELIGVIALIAVAAAVLWKFASPRDLPPPVPVGAQLPPLTAGGWLNVPAGEAFEPTPGRLLVVDCWATYCAPCREEIPRLAKFVDAYGPLGVDFIGVTDERDPAAIGEYIEATPGFDWPVAYDAAPFMAELNIRQIPTVILFGDDGRALWSGIGSFGLEEAIERALVRIAKAQAPAGG
jgi:thiol-disulfide isomerase/thioredoxin